MCNLILGLYKQIYHPEVLCLTPARYFYRLIRGYMVQQQLPQSQYQQNQLVHVELQGFKHG